MTAIYASRQITCGLLSTKCTYRTPAWSPVFTAGSQQALWRRGWSHSESAPILFLEFWQRNRSKGDCILGWDRRWRFVAESLRRSAGLNPLSITWLMITNSGEELQSAD